MLCGMRRRPALMVWTKSWPIDQEPIISFSEGSDIIPKSLWGWKTGHQQARPLLRKCLIGS